MKLSMVTIVKNEEQFIRRMVESAWQVCDEVIIADTGSTDRTKEIARECGATVIDVPWEDSFSAARNEALKHATGDWILQLDGDEVLNFESDRAREHFRRCLKKSKHWPYEVRFIQLKDRLVSNEEVFAEYPQTRLFPNHELMEFRGRVHNRLCYKDGSYAQYAPLIEGCWIDHYGYDPTIYEDKQKSQRLFHLLALDLDEDNPDPLHLYYMGRELIRQGKMISARGYLAQAVPAMLKVPAYHRTTMDGFKLWLQSNPLDAQMVYRMAQKHWPRSPDIHYEWAKHCAKEFRLADAHDAMSLAEACFGAEENQDMPKYIEFRKWEFYVNWASILGERDHLTTTSVGLTSQETGTRWQRIGVECLRKALIDAPPEEAQAIQEVIDQFTT